MKKTIPPIKPERYRVFFDFDNTITRKDIFDDMLVCFSKDQRWKKLERDWREGKIGSRAALSGQIKGIRINKDRLDSYLSGVKPDPYFKKLIHLFKAKNIKVTVLSDNFDYILKKVLDGNCSGRLKIYSNRLRLSGDRLIPAFPFTDKRCRICAHCKKKNLRRLAGRNSTIVYIGDGRSDICPAGYAHIVFAKEELLEFCRKEKLKHIPYKGLKQVYAYFKKRLA
ncbi:MAG: MtnX-like HAD-IB family phosphatase [Candidatus Omnitrophica bacterium]|nr:MtnX-like HAD-IB family phosphatase [Candidatus Omnitrophota bacterium]MBL7210421.1 MtnX-like HAD-IB family phosphatase [Candidatus Omnitrophota bacterium]